MRITIIIGALVAALAAGCGTEHGTDAPDETIEQRTSAAVGDFPGGLFVQQDVGSYACPNPQFLPPWVMASTSRFTRLSAIDPVSGNHQWTVTFMSASVFGAWNVTIDSQGPIVLREQYGVLFNPAPSVAYLHTDRSWQSLARDVTIPDFGILVYPAGTGGTQSGQVILAIDPRGSSSVGYGECDSRRVFSFGLTH